jgi:hypothetical protein
MHQCDQLLQQAVNQHKNARESLYVAFLRIGPVSSLQHSLTNGSVLHLVFEPLLPAFRPPPPTRWLGLATVLVLL